MTLLRIVWISLIQCGKSYRETINYFPFLFSGGGGWFNNWLEGGATVIQWFDWFARIIKAFMGRCFLYQRSE